ncbi:MAG: helix-turn-helix domain-containing protein, partial [Betaproteobacteria bacterium]
MGAREGKPAQAADAETFLARLGAKVRDGRVRRGLTRKALARESAVSERYLAELEAGRGNISVLLLRQVAATLGLPLAELLRENDEQALELTLIHEFLQRLPKQRLAR